MGVCLEGPVAVIVSHVYGISRGLVILSHVRVHKVVPRILFQIDAEHGGLKVRLPSLAPCWPNLGALTDGCVQARLRIIILLGLVIHNILLLIFLSQ